MKIIFVDLDDTLVDTSSFKLKFFRKLSKTTPATFLEINRIYQNSKTKIGEESWFDQFIIKLAEATSTNPKKIEKLLWEEFIKSKVNDKILTKLKSESAKKVILTFGNKKFQSKKIKMLSLLEYFEEVLVTDQSKADILDGYISKDKFVYKKQEFTEIILIDDNQETLKKVQNMLRNVSAIHPSQYAAR